MTTAVVPAARTDTTISGVSTVLALSRFEGRMLLWHPVTWIGALGAGGMAILELREQAPVLNRVSVTLAWTMLPLAAAVALVAGWAVLRARGRSDANPPMVMPVSMAQRVGGIVAGLVFVGASAFILQLLLLGWVMTKDPVTSIVWSEVLAGPVYVMFAGALGAALTRWMPHPATPLLAVLTLAALMIVFGDRQEDWGLNIGVNWLSPLAWPQDIIPYEVAFRPTGLHLGYLAGLGLLLAGIAMLGRWPVGWVVVGVGVVLAAALGPTQLGPIGDAQRAEAMSHLVGDQAGFRCETHQGIDYCAMPGYEAWIDYWVRATGPVVAAVPAAALERVEVRQYPVHVPWILDGQDYNNWWWVQPAYDDLAQRPNVMPVGSMWADYMDIFVARELARVAMGCTPTCEGESQMVIQLWLMSHHPEMRSNIEESMSARRDGAAVAECMVAELWSRPDARTLIHSNWDALTSTASTYDDAGAILGVTVPTGEDEYGYLEHGCP